MSFVAGVVALALVTALACAIPGVFLLLRKDAMMTEAVSHAVLPGIVVGLIIVGDLDSAVLILAAALTGLLVVLGTEHLRSTDLVEGDAPLGLIFPALFSIGIILVSRRFSNVHLDEHVVLVGDLNVLDAATSGAMAFVFGLGFVAVLAGSKAWTRIGAMRSLGT